MTFEELWQATEQNTLADFEARHYGRETAVMGGYGGAVRSSIVVCEAAKYAKGTAKNFRDRAYKAKANATKRRALYMAALEVDGALREFQRKMGTSHDEGSEVNDVRRLLLATQLAEPII